MSNPTHCVMCKAELKTTVVSRPAEERDAAEEGRFQTWDEVRVVAEIYCPRCQLMYRVADPHDLP